MPVSQATSSISEECRGHESASSSGTTARTYTHVVVDERELHYAALLS
jgi:hypothetical protein